jgi:hypothetical protein
MKVITTLFAVLLFAGQAQALGRLADVQIVDRSSGATLPVYSHGGLYYIAGESGHEFQIGIANRGSERVMAVGSVDGVNVISGETAGTDQDGYVLGAWQSMSILGWRKSMDNIAAFYFTRLPDSYAARTGRPDNVGVIGVALFREKSHCCQPLLDQGMRSDSAAPGAAAAPQSGGAERAEKKSEQLGTGHGRIERSEVVYTDFEAASKVPDEIVTIYYDSYRNLRKLGVIPAPRRRPAHRPQAFPGTFVPDP